MRLQDGCKRCERFVIGGGIYKKKRERVRQIEKKFAMERIIKDETVNVPSRSRSDWPKFI